MNDVVVNKAQSIQRCIARAREELRNAGEGFATDYTRQDAAILNLTRACEQSIDLANHLVKTRKLGVPTESAQSFSLLGRAGVISEDLAFRLRKMIGFRNTAVHEYQDISIPIVESIIEEDSNDLLRFTEIALASSMSDE